MQNLSHSTRAYIINADGLPGFLISFELIEFLRDYDSKGMLDIARKWQVIDLDKIQEEL